MGDYESSRRSRSQLSQAVSSNSYYYGSGGLSSTSIHLIISNNDESTRSNADMMKKRVGMYVPESGPPQRKVGKIGGGQCRGV